MNLPKSGNKPVKILTDLSIKEGTIRQPCLKEYPATTFTSTNPKTGKPMVKKKTNDDRMVQEIRFCRIQWAKRCGILQVLPTFWGKCIAVYEVWLSELEGVDCSPKSCK